VWGKRSQGGSEFSVYPRSYKNPPPLLARRSTRPSLFHERLEQNASIIASRLSLPQKLVMSVLVLDNTFVDLNGVAPTG
jgi:hypothetical protein